VSTLLANLNPALGSLLSFLLGLVPLIALHEAGHMLVAKKVGVWVREFGIGLPPRIVTLFHWNETAFTLNWIPLGGFARMEGEDEILASEEQKAEEAQRRAALPPEEQAKLAAEDEERHKHSLYAQPPAKRILIYLGGPVMNLFFGWLLAVLLCLNGVPIIDKALVSIEMVSPNSPAEAAGLEPGDIVLKAAGEPVTKGEPFTQIIRAHAGEPLPLEIQRGEETFVVTPTLRLEAPKGQGILGVSIIEIPLESHIEQMPLGQAIVNGTQYFWNMLIGLLLLPLRLIQGAMPASAARPISIINISRITYQSVQASVDVGKLYPVLSVLIMVNISLGLFNLLPIPALDGGRILLTLVEMVSRKPLTPQQQEKVHQVTVIFLLLILAAIMVLDVLYPVDLPAP
jgi:regulator of sigma E protease